MNFNCYQPDGEHHFINTNYPGLICIHKKPYIFLVDNFLTHNECDNIINNMKDKNMANAQVAGSNPNLIYRKCLSMSVYKHIPEFYLFENVREKVTSLTNVNENQLEVINITRYLGNENYFKSHDDAYEYGYGFEKGYTNDKKNNRIITVIIYLNDVNTGGETRFTDINLDVKPKKGSALIFFPGYLPTSKKNPGCRTDNTTHEALPPNGEEKWILQQWIWPEPYLAQ